MMLEDKTKRKFKDDIVELNDKLLTSVKKKKDFLVDEVKEIVSTSLISNKWQETIIKVVKAVVSVHFAHVVNFDTETSSVSEATGFIVDIKRGLVLTNRHVVGPGPFTGYIIFDNHEEVEVKPIFRDPVHDFGFLKFDPDRIKYMKLTQLELKPELSTVGTEIRVIGNDAGEKLSILAGFISRIDRNAPDYGPLTYNDFNTEYIQAAASASGGSSGSPVVNENGDVVAIQAGGSTEAATDFFLPAYRPLRALKCIQQSKKITRGDIQVEWLLKPYDECRRLGLKEESEKNARKLFPDQIGLLVAEIILPDGPAYNLIKEGDTLISIDGIPVTKNIEVDEILDESVGKTLEFILYRNGKKKTLQIKIGDLYSTTPNKYVTVAGASFNDLSYQIAINYCIPVKGVFINDSSGSFELSAFEKTGWILDSVDDKPTPNLDVFIEVMKQISDRQKVSISYRHVSDLHTQNFQIIYIERHWNSEFKLVTCNNDTGLWDSLSLQEKSLELQKEVPKNAKFIDIPFSDHKLNGCSFLGRSFVQVRSIIPICMDAFFFTKELGYGVVLDSTNGYVLISRRFVPHDCCDVFIIFAESIDVPGDVVFLHPTQNYAIIKYDPSLILADVRTPNYSNIPLKRGDSSHFIGYNFHSRLVTEDVKISATTLVSVPPNLVSPRYRATNFECISVNNKLCQECDSGILCDSDGTVRAFWLTCLGETVCDQSTNRSYRMGLDVTNLLTIIELLKKNQLPENLRILDIEFNSINVFQSRIRGVTEEIITKFENNYDDDVRFLTIDRVSAPHPKQEKNPLEIGDIILSVNDKLVKSIKDLNIMYTEEKLNFKLIRKKKELFVTVPTIDSSTVNTSHIVIWSGAILQPPHHSVRQLLKKTPSEVYVVQKNPGCPANQYGIENNSFITYINDQETPDLNSFVEIVKKIPSNTYVKITLVSFDQVTLALSLKTNHHYFPTSELKRDPVLKKWTKVHY